MNIIKKIIALLCAVALISSILAVSAAASTYYDVPESEYYTEAIEALTTYGIVSGYEGSFRPYAQITRAEFAKMTAIISGLDDEVYSSAGNKKFDDVSIDNWATGYINTVANNKLLVGYPDGRFMPDKCITYAEAVTVVLRCLGYSTADLGDNWPYSYMVKAKSLGLTDGLTFSDNAPISRADVCVVINRALDTEINHSVEKLISMLEITAKEDVFLISTKAIEPELASDEIRTDIGIFKTTKDAYSFQIPSKGTVFFNKDNEIINFEQTEEITQKITTVESIVNGDVYFADGTSCVGLGVSNSTGVFNDGVITTYGSFKNSIHRGARVTIAFDKEKTVKLLLIGNAEYTEAVTVYSDLYTALSGVGVSKEKIDRAEIIRDGYAATIDDAEVYDIAYFVEEESKIYLYSDKVSGTYNKAYPNKANVTSVEISGMTLELETPSAISKLGEKSGSYKLGSRVTALLGRDGKIADVVDLNSSGKANYGILLSYSTEDSTDSMEAGKQYNYITVINGEGKTMKYKTKIDYSERIGLVGTLSFDSDGYVSFSALSSTKKISGDIDKNKGTIGNRWLTSDCVILERTYIPDTHSGTATAQEIKLEDFDISSLSESQVVHAVISGDFEDISLLIVENITNDSSVYGIIESVGGGASTKNASGLYTVFSNGSTKTYSASFYNKIPAGTAVALQFEGNSLASIKRLYAAAISRTVSAIDSNRLKIDDRVYALSDNVQIIQKKSSGYIGLSKYDIDELEGKSVTIHTDSNSKDSLVRIIVVNN